MRTLISFGLRLVGGFGAVGFGLNRLVARLPGPLGATAGRRPLGLAVTVIVLIALVVRGVALAAPYLTPRAITPSDIGHLGSEDLAVTLTGLIADSYIVTFLDANRDGVQQDDEHGTQWIYFVGGADRTPGIQVRSSRAPAEMYAGTPEVSITGRLSPRSGLGGLLFRVPDFDARTLPFPLADSFLDEGAEFPAVRAARDGAVVFGGLAVMFILAWRFRYLPFRPVPPAGIGLDQSALPARSPVRAVLNGIIAGRRGPEMVRSVPIAVHVAERATGRRTLVLIRGVNDIVEQVDETARLVAGEAVGLTEVRHAIRAPGRYGDLVVAFDLVSDRDDCLGAMIHKT
jgi:hypothetical protein